MPNKILTLDEIMKLRNNIEMRDALIDSLKHAEKRIIELEIKNRQLTHAHNIENACKKI